MERAGSRQPWKLIRRAWRPRPLESGGTDIPNIGKIEDKVARVSFKFMGDSYSVQYKMEAIDDEYERRLNEAAQQENSNEAVLAVVLEIITDWSVERVYVRDESEPGGVRLPQEGEEGELMKVPLDAALVTKPYREGGLPTPFLGMVRNTIQQDATNGGQQAKKR